MEVAKRELELEEISKKLENYKAHLALQKIRTTKKLWESVLPNTQPKIVFDITSIMSNTI